MKDFMRGMICYGALSSLRQDIIYRTAENYSDYILNNWIDKSITIPLALIMLIYVFVSGLSKEKF